MQVDLRAVEGAVARVQLIRKPLRVERLGERGLGAVPHLVRADALLGPGGELEPRLDLEALIQVEAEPQALHDLVLDLLFGAEDVRVVLGDVANAQQPVEDAAGLVAVHEARLGVAHGQVAIGAPLVLVDLDMRRAVHRLQAHRASIGVGEVHVVLVLLPVPGLVPELDVVEDRSFHLLVAAREVLGAPQLGELVEDRHAGRLPERAAGRELGEHEQLQLAPELAVIARLGELDLLEAGLQLLGGEVSGAVDPGEHLL